MSLGNRPDFAPVHNIQQMLRTALPDNGLVIDGIFGKETEDAVRRFQKSQDMEPTGVADENTWVALKRAYNHEQVLFEKAEPLRIVLQPHQVLTKGTNNSHMYLVQALLLALSLYISQLPHLTVNGKLDAETEKSIRLLQKAADLPETGELDKHTWSHLVHLYRSFIGDGTGAFPVRNTKT